MAAQGYLVIVIATNNDTIAQLNSKVLSKVAGNQDEGMKQVENYLNGIAPGFTSAVVQVTSRDTDPTVTTSGTGSKQVTYNLA